MMKRKTVHIAAANLVAVVIALAVMWNVSSLQPLYPLQNTITDERRPQFQWQGTGEQYTLLVDDDQDFSSPMEFAVAGNLYTPGSDLEFGTYWWKVTINGVESGPRKLMIVSKVALSRLQKDVISNSGNTPVIVHRSPLEGAFVLGVNETTTIGEEESVKAEQK